jgi:parvulin-like peptidyl-prolyl isomerase
MKPTRVVLSVLIVLVVLVAAACGSNDKSVPADAVAVVDGTPVTKTDLDALLVRAKKSYTANKRTFPKAGTAEYQALQTQAVAILVQRAEFDKQAAELKLTVTDKEIQDRIDQVKKQYFAGDQAKLDEQLKTQGYTTEAFQADMRAQLLSQKIYDEVTKDAKVTDAQVTKYYNDSKAQYAVAESRDVRHILIAVNRNGVGVSGVKTGGDTTVDFAKSKPIADKIYQEIKGGADFATLAKQWSQDPGSKQTGGKLTITRGQTVAPFDTTAFLLAANQLSRPVKTQFGYHLIEPLSAIKPATTRPLKDVRAEIRKQLEDKAKNDAITNWTAKTKKLFVSKIVYAGGYAPPAAATDTSATTTG